MDLYDVNAEFAHDVADWSEEDEWADEFSSQQHFLRVASQCTRGVLESVSPFLARSIACTIAQRIIWSHIGGGRRPIFRKLADFFVGAIGVLLSWQNSDSFEASATVFFYFILTTLFCIFALGRSAWTGHVCVLLTLLYTTFCQVCVFDAVTFTALRGSLMIAAMKQISLAYDVVERGDRSAKNEQRSEKRTRSRKERSKERTGRENSDERTRKGSVDLLPDDDKLAQFLAIFAFIFQPATLSFGPFIGFREFLAARDDARGGGGWWSAMATAPQFFALSIFFLLYSSCLADQLPQLLIFVADAPLPRFLVDFAVGFAGAQSFRFSHYFVCYLADALTALAGLKFRADGGDSRATRTTNWRAIEWPWAMSEVVVAWNFPMHTFLHKYVFQGSRKSVGHFAAMLLTFCTSAFLHGLNFQLNAVLISLAFYAFSESAFRNRLAERFSACVRSRKCGGDGNSCVHRFKRNNFWVTAINVAFTFLNIYHLAYLGAPFGATDDDAAAATSLAEVGFHWRHTMNVWRAWRFASHLIALSALLLSRLI